MISYEALHRGCLDGHDADTFRCSDFQKDILHCRTEASHHTDFPAGLTISGEASVEQCQEVVPDKIPYVWAGAVVTCDERGE